MLLFLLFFFHGAPAQAGEPLSFPKAQNFRLSSADDVNHWLLPLAAWQEDNRRWNLTLLGAVQPKVSGLYHDLSSKNENQITQRLQDSYGDPFEAEAKVGIRARFGNFEQSFSIDAGASLLVNDPVFPELTGILYNDYAFESRYRFWWQHVWFRPGLTYGIRRTMEQSLSVGQLLDAKPNVVLSHYPYRFFADMSLQAGMDFSWGSVALDVEGVPLWSSAYLYWQAELSARSRNLLSHSSILWTVWASLVPLRGGVYSFEEGVKVGTSVRWLPYLQTDFFLMDKFRPAALLRLGPSAWNLELFTFARSEDQFGLFTARQYGLNIHGSL